MPHSSTDSLNQHINTALHNNISPDWWLKHPTHRWAKRIFQGNIYPWHLLLLQLINITTSTVILISADELKVCFLDYSNKMTHTDSGDLLASTHFQLFNIATAECIVFKSLKHWFLNIFSTTVPTKWIQLILIIIWLALLWHQSVKCFTYQLKYINVR